MNIYASELRHLFTDLGSTESDVDECRIPAHELIPCRFLSLLALPYPHLADKKFPYIEDSQAFATPANVIRMLFWTAFVPLWRGLVIGPPS